MKSTYNVEFAGNQIERKAVIANSTLYVDFIYVSPFLIGIIIMYYGYKYHITNLTKNQ